MTIKGFKFDDVCCFDAALPATCWQTELQIHKSALSDVIYLKTLMSWCMFVSRLSTSCNVCVLQRLIRPPQPESDGRFLSWCDFWHQLRRRVTSSQPSQFAFIWARKASVWLSMFRGVGLNSLFYFSRVTFSWFLYSLLLLLCLSNFKFQTKTWAAGVEYVFSLVYNSLTSTFHDIFSDIETFLEV